MAEVDDPKLRIWRGLPAVVEAIQGFVEGDGGELPAAVTEGAAGAKEAAAGRSKGSPTRIGDGRAESASADSGCHPEDDVLVPWCDVELLLQSVYCCSHPNSTEEDISAAVAAMSARVVEGQRVGRPDSRRGVLPEGAVGASMAATSSSYSKYDIFDALEVMAEVWAPTGVPPSDSRQRSVLNSEGAEGQRSEGDTASLAASAGERSSERGQSPPPDYQSEGTPGTSLLHSKAQRRHEVAAFLREVADCVLSDDTPPVLIPPARVLVVPTRSTLLSAHFRDFVTLKDFPEYDEVLLFLWNLLFDGAQEEPPEARIHLSMQQFTRFASWIYRCAVQGVPQGFQSPRLGEHAARRIWYEFVNGEGNMTIREFSRACTYMGRRFAKSSNAVALLRSLRAAAMQSFAHRSDFSGEAFFATTVNLGDLQFARAPDDLSSEPPGNGGPDPSKPKQASDYYMADELDAIMYNSETFFHREPLSDNRVLVYGKDAVGKSTYARALAQHLRAVHIDVADLALAEAVPVAQVRGYAPLDEQAQTPKANPTEAGDGVLGGSAKVAIDEADNIGEQIYSLVLRGHAIPLSIQARLVSWCINDPVTRFRGFVFGDLPFSSASFSLEHFDRFLEDSDLLTAIPTAMVHVTCVDELYEERHDRTLRQRQCEREEAVARLVVERQSAAAVASVAARRSHLMQVVTAFVEAQSEGSTIMEEDLAALKAAADEAAEELRTLDGDGAGDTTGAVGETAKQDANGGDTLSEFNETGGSKAAPLDDAAGGNAAGPETEAGVVWFELTLRELIRQGRMGAPYGVSRPWLASATSRMPTEQTGEGEDIGADISAALSKSRLSAPVDRAKVLHRMVSVGCVSAAEEAAEYVTQFLGLHPTVLPIAATVDASALAGLESEVARADLHGTMAWASLVSQGYHPSPIWKRYCPVTFLEDDGILVEGSKSYSCAYRGEIYCCATMEKMRHFMQNPLRFLQAAFVGSREPVLLLSKSMGLFSSRSSQSSIKGHLNVNKVVEALSKTLRLTPTSLTTYADVWQKYRALVNDRAAAFAQRRKMELKERQARDERLKRRLEEIQQQQRGEQAGKKQKNSGRAKGNRLGSAPKGGATQQGRPKGKERVRFLPESPTGAGGGLNDESRDVVPGLQSGYSRTSIDGQAGDAEVLSSIGDAIQANIRFLRSQRENLLPLLVSTTSSDPQETQVLHQMLQEGVLPKIIVVLDDRDASDAAEADQDSIRQASDVGDAEAVASDVDGEGDGEREDEARAHGVTSAAATQSHETSDHDSGHLGIARAQVTPAMYRRKMEAFINEVVAASAGDSSAEGAVEAAPETKEGAASAAHCNGIFTVSVKGKSEGDVAEELLTLLYHGALRATEPDPLDYGELLSDFDEDLVDTDDEDDVEAHNQKLAEREEEEEQELEEDLELLLEENGADEEAKERVMAQFRSRPRASWWLRPRRHVLHQLGRTLRYCPVSLHTRGLLIRGSLEYSLVYKAKRYVFASAEAMQQFKAHPARFANPKGIVPPRLWVLGVGFSGKRTLARRFKDAFGVPAFYYNVPFLEKVAEAANSAASWTSVDGVMIPGGQHSNTSLSAATRILRELRDFSLQQEQKRKLKEDTEKRVQAHEEAEEARFALGDEGSGSDSEDFEDTRGNAGILGLGLTEEEETERIQDILSFEPEEEEEKEIRLHEAHLTIAAHLTRIEPFNTNGYVLVGPDFTEADVDAFAAIAGTPEAAIHLKVTRDAYVGRGLEALKERREQRANDLKEKALHPKTAAADPQPHFRLRLRALEKWRRRNLGEESHAADETDDAGGGEAVGVVADAADWGDTGSGGSGGDGLPSRALSASEQRAFLEESLDKETAKVSELIDGLKEHSVPLVRVFSERSADAVFQEVCSKMRYHLDHRRSMFWAVEVISHDHAWKVLEDGRKVPSSFGVVDPVELFDARAGAVDVPIIPSADVLSSIPGAETGWPTGVSPAGADAGNAVRGGSGTWAGPADGADDLSAHDAGEPAADGSEASEDEEDLESEVAPDEAEEMRARLARAVARRSMEVAPRACILGNRVFFFKSDENLSRFCQNPLRFWDQPPPLPSVAKPVVAVFETKYVGDVGGRSWDAESRPTPPPPRRKVALASECLAYNLRCPIVSVASLLTWAMLNPLLLGLQRRALAAAVEDAVVEPSLLATLLLCRLQDAGLLRSGAVLSNFPADVETLQRVIARTEGGAMVHHVVNLTTPAHGGDDRWARWQLVTETFARRVAAKSVAPTGAAVAAAPLVPPFSLLAELFAAVRENETHRRLAQEADGLGFPVCVANASLREEELSTHLGPYGWYCALTWILEHRLHALPTERVNIACFLGHYYVFASAEYLAIFLRHPDQVLSEDAMRRFMETPLPECVNLASADGREAAVSPASRTAICEWSEGRRALELSGCCPVLLYDTRTRLGMRGIREPEAVPGRLELGVAYNGGLYVLSSEDCHVRFLREPWTFIQEAWLPPPHRMPLEPDQVRDLSEEDYVRRTLYDGVARAMLAAAEVRPKYPGLSLEDSALKFIGLHLKAHRRHDSDIKREQCDRSFQCFVRRATAYKAVEEVGAWAAAMFGHSAASTLTAVPSSSEAAAGDHCVALPGDAEAATQTVLEACTLWREATAGPAIQVALRDLNTVRVRTRGPRKAARSEEAQ